MLGLQDYFTFEARALEARNQRKIQRQLECDGKEFVGGPSNPVMHSPRLGPSADVHTGARPKSFVLKGSTRGRGRGRGSPVDYRSQSSQTSQDSQQEEEEGEGFRSGYERRGQVRARSPSPSAPRSKKSSRR